MRKPSWASCASAFTVWALLIAAPAGCGDEPGEALEGATLRVYVSLSLRGPSGADGRDAADGARLALADAGDEAGGIAVEAVFLDDTEGEGAEAGWTPAQAAANARRASQDSTAIAYLGDFESGATRASLPITNEARMLQVSPASGAVDLVAPFAGSDDVPQAQPSGERSFGRVIPADDTQAEAAARWARQLGWRRTAVKTDGTGFGRTLADAFEAEADELGIEVVRGRRGTVGGYFAGSPERFDELGDDLVASSARGPVQMASDAFLPPYPAGLRPGLIGPTYVTSAALDPSRLPAAGRELARRFEAEYGRSPGRYAAYGYEAMAAILDSIEHASDSADREAVIDAFFDTAERDSVLGTYSIDEVGDTTLDRIAGYELVGGRARPVTKLSAAP